MLNTCGRKITSSKTSKQTRLVWKSSSKDLQHCSLLWKILNNVHKTSRPKGRAPKKTPSTPREFPSPLEEAGRESRSGQGGHRGQMGLGGQGGGAGAKAGWAAPAAGAPRAPARAYQRGQGCCYMTPSSCKRGWHGTASFVARKRACPKRRSESFFKVF